MDAFNYTTKASRINRKRGWKIADLFPDCWRVSVEGGFLSVPHPFRQYAYPFRAPKT